MEVGGSLPAFVVKSSFAQNTKDFNLNEVA